VLNGKPLDRDIANALGQSVRLENDANFLATSEAIDGAGAVCRVVFGAILGTGVGGGIVVERRILTGLDLIALAESGDIIRFHGRLKASVRDTGVTAENSVA
jgi:fructokinase